MIWDNSMQQQQGGLARRLITFVHQIHLTNIHHKYKFYITFAINTCLLNV